MPKIIKAEDGSDMEVFDKSELDAAAKSAAEARAKELEQEINPNWKEARKTMSDMERQIKERDAKLAELGVKSQEKSLDSEEVARIADKRFLERYKSRLLEQYGDKRDVVEKYFDKLASGEQLDESKIEQFAEDAARAAGVSNGRKPNAQQMFARSGSRPQFESNSNGQDEGFGASAAGKATAAAMGIIIENPNKK